MPRSSIEKTLRAAQRIRKSIEKISFVKFYITVSIGISQTSHLITTPQALIRSADDALYQAKSNGKNQVVLASIAD